jgi:hypothetical protein
MCKTCGDQGYILDDDGGSRECEECNSHKKIEQLPRQPPLLQPVPKRNDRRIKPKRP